MSQLNDSPRDPRRVALERLLGAPIHYEMREAVDAFPYLRTPAFAQLLNSLLSLIPADYHAVLAYQLLWMRECYPFPPLAAAQANQGAGQYGRFVSIAAGIGDRAPSRAVGLLWAAETEGAFLRAASLEAMRDVAMDYPILLRPGVQGGIDSTIEHHLAEPERSECSNKLRYLQLLREEIEGHPVESWWRPIMRQHGIDVSTLRRVTSGDDV